MPIETPNWVKHAIFYQIFPDRFAHSHNPPTQLPQSIPYEDWDAPPTYQGYKGGNLWGILERLDYLQDLGINALYFTPIFQSASNHRYHTHDYYQVDPLLGGNEAFGQLLQTAHDRNIKIILDGVFNHCSRGFFFFNDILENGPFSPWLDGSRSKTGLCQPTTGVFLPTTKAGPMSGHCQNSTTGIPMCGNTSWPLASIGSNLALTAGA